MQFLNPKTDFAFKKIFGSEESKDVLISFLNALLDLSSPYCIEDIEFLVLPPRNFLFCLDLVGLTRLAVTN